MEAARTEDFQRDLQARRDFFGSAAEYQSRMFDASTAYNQIIIIGGYAAFFGVWSAFSNQIDSVIVLISGTLVLISLVIYVTWTVIGMFQLGRRNIEAIASFNGGVDGFAERIQAVELAAQQRSLGLLEYWPIVVWASGFTGLVAALMLSGAALWKVIPKLPSSKPDPTAAAVRRAEAAATAAKCGSYVASIYARSRGGSGTTATNPKTGDHAVLVGSKWIVLPRC